MAKMRGYPKDQDNPTVVACTQAIGASSAEIPNCAFTPIKLQLARISVFLSVAKIEGFI